MSGLKNFLLLVFFTPIVLVACIEEVVFDSEDAQVVSLIDAVEQYVSDNGQAPESLQDLIPDYVPELPQPEWAQSIYYEYDTESGEWEIRFNLENGGTATYFSDGHWMNDTFPR